MAAALLVCLCASSAARADAPAVSAGVYKLDNRHSSITFKIDHLGFSRFTGRFDQIEGSLTYNPDAPRQSALDVTVYTNTIDTNDSELDDDLRGGNWFDTIKYPTAVFHVTGIDLLGGNKLKVTGDFTLHNVTHVLTLDAELVGAGKDALTGAQVMGFSASGSFNRSDYGMRNLIPMVGDKVSLQIESEFDKGE